MWTSTGFPVPGANRGAPLVPDPRSLAEHLEYQEWAAAEVAREHRPEQIPVTSVYREGIPVLQPHGFHRDPAQVLHRNLQV